MSVCLDQDLSCNSANSWTSTPHRFTLNHQLAKPANHQKLEWEWPNYHSPAQLFRHVFAHKQFLDLCLDKLMLKKKPTLQNPNRAQSISSRALCSLGKRCDPMRHPVLSRFCKIIIPLHFSSALLPAFNAVGCSSSCKGYNYFAAAIWEHLRKIEKERKNSWSLRILNKIWLLWWKPFCALSPPGLHWWDTTCNQDLPICRKTHPSIKLLVEVYF